MFKLSSEKDMIKEINSYGKKSFPQYVCINPDVERRNGHRYVLIQTIEHKQQKIVKYSNLKKFNPFSRGDIADSFVLDKINKIGMSQSPKYICINSNSLPKEKKRYVKVQCLKSKKIKEVLYHSLIEGKNPFNESQNRLEVEKVQPMYERLFKKLKINYIKEFKMGKKSIDFMFQIRGKKYGLEVKQSEKWHSDKNQLETYRKLSNLKPFGLTKVILSDPKGKHSHRGSLSIQEFKNFILNEV